MTNSPSVPSVPSVPEGVYGNCRTVEVMEMPRCCSRAIQSEVADRRPERAFTAPASLVRAPP